MYKLISLLFIPSVDFDLETAEFRVRLPDKRLKVIDDCFIDWNLSPAFASFELHEGSN